MAEHFTANSQVFENAIYINCHKPLRLVYQENNADVIKWIISYHIQYRSSKSRLLKATFL